MNSTVPAVLPRRGVVPLRPSQARELWVRRRVSLAWGLLVLNILTFYPGISVVPIPSVIGKAITQGALPAALLVALTVNPRIVIRPNAFLCMLSLLLAEALMTTFSAQFLVSASYRTFRFVEFVAVLWLLSPWFGRRDLVLVRSYLTMLYAALGSVILGQLVAPGRAGGLGGRLTGVIWPIPPTQVAHYAAVTAGITTVLWLCGLTRGRNALLVVLACGGILVLTHTRTALIGLVAGLLVAGLSLFIAKARVRRLFATAGVLVSIAAITLSSVLATWLARGENAQQLTSLTGRTPVWQAVLNAPRDWFQVIFGSGLSNNSFGGLAIDSNWLAAYSDQGLIGVGLVVSMVLYVLIAAYFQPPGVRRALPLFLVTYCLVASFTETGLSQPSSYMLELALAASLLVPSSADKVSA
jgi:O-antigen ligase/polysaccharide polymerase Wzy-like membrane protein